MVLGDRPEQRRGEPAGSGVGANLPHVHGDDPALCCLYPLDDLALDGEGAHEAVEVGDDDDVASPLSTISTARRRPSRFASGVPPDTSSYLMVSTSVRPSCSQARAIRSSCSDGETKRSPSRSPVRLTRTTPTARRAQEGAMVEEGKPAPDFTLVTDLGERVKLSSFRGHPIVLYFYPGDDTPGCTKEACGFRDAYDQFQERGAVILGVSPDAEESHIRFKRKYDLPFALLADTDHEAAEKYGVWVEKTSFGKKRMGIKRSTFVIDADGTLAKAMYGVKPDGHADKVLAVLP
jgi:peroxiredoxin Q/BCP